MSLAAVMEEEPKDSTYAQVLPRRGSVELQKVEAAAEVPLKDRDSFQEKTRVSFPRPDVIYAPKKLSNWMSCFKYSLFIFNGILWLFAVALIAVTIWVKLRPEFLALELNLDVKALTSAAHVILAVGVIILVIGFMGCWGAIRENKCLLVAYFTVTIILFILQIVGFGIAAGSMNSKYKDDILDKIRKGVDGKDGNEILSHFIDRIQSQLHCCGVDGPDRYEEFLPTSCMDIETGLPYTKGCLDASWEFLKSVANVLIAIAVVAVVLQVGGIVFSCCLWCGIRGRDSLSV